jgi:hypothetical protein
MGSLTNAQKQFLAMLMDANDRILTDADLVELERERRIAEGEPDLTATEIFAGAYRGTR